MVRLKIAVVLALVAVPPLLSAVVLLGEERDEGAAKTRSCVTVFAAKKELAAGTVIRDPSAHFVLKTVAPSTVPEGSFHQLEEIRNLQLTQSIAEGEYITKRHDYRSELKERVRQFLPGGVPITVQYDPGFGGLFQPMDRVNLFLVKATADGQSETKSIMANVLIVANDVEVADDVEAVADTKPTVTLAVLPAQAAQLKTDLRAGELHLSLVRFPPD
jgi:Flp pilus assembly protein CpaB